MPNSIESNPDVAVLPIYRIGSQVHDHEARIRMLERDSIVLTEGMKSLKETMAEMSGDLHSHIADLRDNNDRRLTVLTDKFDEHVDRENKDRTKLIAAVTGNFLTSIATIAGILFALWEFSHK